MPVVPAARQSRFEESNPVSQPDYASYRARKTFSSLDGFRCASILAVIWHHTSNGAMSWLPAAGRGFLGVDMFFVLSGFLIVTLLLREQETNGVISLGKFYARRAFRIFPIYYAVLAILFVVLAFVKPTANMAKPFFAELPFYLTYTSNWIQASTLLSITWSLAAEEQFYVVWPPVEKFFGKAIMPTLVVVIFINQLINFHLLDDFLLQSLGPDVGELRILQATFTPICLGVLLAHILHDEKTFAIAWKGFSHPASPLAVLALLFVLCNVRMQDISGWARLSIQLSMMLLIGSCVLRDEHVLRRVLTLPIVMRLGAISYGMYLFHMFARHGADVVLERSPLRFAGDLFILCFVATWLISEISFRFYEQPFLTLKKRFETAR
jgi:peptidoglycan/LPS O-acetylase OafA/YrhL